MRLALQDCMTVPGYLDFHTLFIHHRNKELTLLFWYWCLLVLLQAPKNLVLRAPPKHKHAMNTGISLLFAPFLPDKEHGGSHYLAEIVERYNSSFFSCITTSDAVQLWNMWRCRAPGAHIQAILHLFCCAKKSKRDLLPHWDSGPEIFLLKIFICRFFRIQEGWVV